MIEISVGVVSVKGKARATVRKLEREPGLGTILGRWFLNEDGEWVPVAVGGRVPDECRLWILYDDFEGGA